MYLPEFLNLGTGFSKYFEALPALDDELRAAAFRIRHAVYCDELGYEPIRPDRMETDAFDARSAHCLLRSIANREYVGCVRLVMADPGAPHAPLPFERLCGPALDRGIVDLDTVDRRKVAEVSRLAVVARYRRRKGEQKVPLGLDEGDFGTPDRPRFPYIAAGLYLGMIAQARHFGIDTLFMLTERRLAKQLARLGVSLTTIGPPVEHRGLRYPSMMSVQEVIDGLNFFVRPLFAVIAGEMETAYQKAGHAR
ncbi:MAG: PEP-CTERM/exosortase system-associated acyltransferase [Betaproteobacteria bacterium]|nr:PEP-CTERM/exosortase system-associated acyltransferase [Betaproteobacteria bacterium]